MIGVAVALAALTGWCLVAAPPRPIESRRRRRAGRGAEVARQRLLVGVAVVGAMTVAVAGGDVARLAVAAAVVVVTGVWALRAHRAQRGAERARLQVSEVCQVLSSQLQAGQVPGRALLVAADDCELLDRAASSQRIGADVPAALREAAERPGCSGLLALAAAWQVAERSGAPVASLVARVAEQQRDDQRVRAMVAGELAAPRATGTMLAFLPLVGVAMAAMIGARPLQFLTGTSLGAWCVLAAAVLSCAGVIWTEHIAQADTGARRRSKGQP